MTNKKILIFAPYGRWKVHHQVDAVLGASLRERGCDVLALCCDGIFVNCPISIQKQFCEECAEDGVSLFKFFDLPVIQISEFISQQDTRQCIEWLDNIPVESLPFAVFDNKELGKCVSSGIFSFFNISKIDLTNKNIIVIYKSMLLNGAYITLAYKRILNLFYPDHILCYSCIHAFYRIFFMLAQQNNIPVLCHERGFINDSFSFLANEHDALYSGRTEAWQNWKKIPLNKE
ncbi:capsule polysaccharide biosynthesis protein, partial [Candidatus Magnetomorum sp. HK-1]